MRNMVSKGVLKVIPNQFKLRAWVTLGWIFEIFGGFQQYCFREFFERKKVSRSFNTHGFLAAKAVRGCIFGCGLAEAALLLEGVSCGVKILHEFIHSVLHAHAPASREQRFKGRRPTRRPQNMFSDVSANMAPRWHQGTITLRAFENNVFLFLENAPK